MGDDGDEEEAPSGRSRLYARSLCTVRPRMVNQGIGGVRSSQHPRGSNSSGRGAKRNMAPRDNPASGGMKNPRVCIIPRLVLAVSR